MFQIFKLRDFFLKHTNLIMGNETWMVNSGDETEKNIKAVKYLPPDNQDLKTKR